MFEKTVKILKKNNTSSPNTFQILLKKCKNLKQFKEIHAHLLKSQLPESPLSISLLFSVSSISHHAQIFTHACSVFRHLSHRNIFIYNTMIRGHVQTHSPVSAIGCYLDMLCYGLMANNYTFPPLVKACTLISMPSSDRIGRLVHTHVVEFGYLEDPFVVSALIEFYSSVLDMGTARRLFDGMTRKDVVLWTAMIDGYGKIGDVEKARKLFEEMPERNVISWSVMMATYSRTSEFKEVLELFRQMQEVGIRPNESVLVSVLTACANVGALGQGVWIHSYARHYGLLSNPILATAIADMYAKCGHVDSALSVFEGIPNKDTGAWNAIISGAAMNSDAKKSLELFNRMIVEGAQPNETTFISILNACTHAGLVTNGMTVFDQMSAIYKVKPRLEHCACVVDLLARAGMVEEAENFIEEKMGGFGEGDANVWGALLGACRNHRNVEVGDRVWKKLAGLGIVDYGIYMILYNMYKEASWESEAMDIRRLIKGSGLKKKPGCSSIEVDGGVVEFIAGDLSHPQGGKMCEVLNSLFKVVVQNVSDNV